MTLMRLWRSGPCALALSAVLATLAGCGGGGAGGPDGPTTQPGTAGDGLPPPTASLAAPAALMATPSPSGRQLQLQWAAVDGASRYELWREPDGPGGPQPATRLAETAANQAEFTLPLEIYNSQATRVGVMACGAEGCGAASQAAVDTASLAGVLRPQALADGLAAGTAVALSANGSVLVAGLPGRDVSFDGQRVERAGAVLVATWAQGRWETVEVPSPRPMGGGSFGRRVAVSGDGKRIAVMAEAVVGGAVVGQVHLLQRDGLAWKPLTVLLPWRSGTDQFGTILALSADGRTVLAGTGRTDDGMGSLVVERVDELGNLEQVQILAPSPGRSWAGAKAALSADGRLVVASSSSVGTPEGAVNWALEAFEPDESPEGGWRSVPLPREPGWTWAGADTGTDMPDEAIGGIALSADGRRLAVGLPNLDDIGGAQDAGGVALFERGAEGWRLLFTQRRPSPHAFDNFGASVALSADGSLLAVGAPGDQSDSRLGDGPPADPVPDTSIASGAIQLFRLDGLQAQPLVVLKPPRGARLPRIGAMHFGPGVGFVSNLALSADGRSLAAGDPGQDAGAPGVTTAPLAPPRFEDGTGSKAGAVYLY